MTDFNDNYSVTCIVPTNPNSTKKIKFRFQKNGTNRNLFAYEYVGTAKQFYNEVIRFEIHVAFSSNALGKNKIVGRFNLNTGQFLNNSELQTPFFNIDNSELVFFLGIVTVMFRIVATDTAKRINNNIFASQFKELQSNGYQLSSIVKFSSKIMTDYYLNHYNGKKIYLIVNIIQSVSYNIDRPVAYFEITWDDITFYCISNGSVIFPVNLVDNRWVDANCVDKMREKKLSRDNVETNTNSVYESKYLAYEILFKGPITITAKNSNNNYIGSTQIALTKLNKNFKFESRTGLSDFMNEAYFDYSKIKLTNQKYWFSEKFETRVSKLENIQIFDVAKSSMHKPVLASELSVEFYFYPDLPRSVDLSESLDISMLENEKKLELKKLWDFDALSWYQSYKYVFPKTEILHYYSAFVESKGGYLQSLNEFITPFCGNDEMSMPHQAFYYVSNIPFIKGDSTEFMYASSLFQQKFGTITGHAIMLTSLLIGMTFDAYVAIGSTWKNPYEPYMWVVQRNLDKSVTFWDPYTRKTYILPNRFGFETREPGVDVNYNIYENYEDASVKSSERNYNNGRYICDLYNSLATGLGYKILDYPLADIELEDYYENIEEIQEKILNKNLDNNQFDSDGLAYVEQQNIMNNMISQYNVAFHPVNKLLLHENLAYTTYKTLNIMFNHTNVYRNLQNINPNVIYYDVESPFQWAALYSKDSKTNTLSRDHVVLTELSEEIDTESIQNSLVSEITDMITMFRNLKALNSYINTDDVKVEYYSSLLNLLEVRDTLDPTVDIGFASNKQGFLVDYYNRLINEFSEKMNLNVDKWYSNPYELTNMLTNSSSDQKSEGSKNEYCSVNYAKSGQKNIVRKSALKLESLDEIVNSMLKSQKRNRATCFFTINPASNNMVVNFMQREHLNELSLSLIHI